MILPRAWIPKAPTYDIGQRNINLLIALSKPDPCPKVLGIFERQSPAQRQRNAYKSVASRMAMKFAKGVQL